MYWMFLLFVTLHDICARTCSYNLFFFSAVVHSSTWSSLHRANSEWIWIACTLGLLYITLQRPLFCLFLKAQVQRVFKGIYLVVELNQYCIGYKQLWLYQMMQNCSLKLTFRSRERESALFYVLSNTQYSRFKLCQSVGYEVLSLCA